MLLYNWFCSRLERHWKPVQVAKFSWCSNHSCSFPTPVSAQGMEHNYCQQSKLMKLVRRIHVSQCCVQCICCITKDSKVTTDLLLLKKMKLISLFFELIFSPTTIFFNNASALCLGCSGSSDSFYSDGSLSVSDALGQSLHQHWITAHQRKSNNTRSGKISHPVAKFFNPATGNSRLVYQPVSIFFRQGPSIWCPYINIGCKIYYVYYYLFIETWQLKLNEYENAVLYSWCLSGVHVHRVCR